MKNIARLLKITILSLLTIIPFNVFSQKQSV
jgi:hypothetical protein